MRRVSVLEPNAGASGEMLSAEPCVRADAACGATEASGEAVSGEARTGQESPRTCEPLAEGRACVKALGSDRRHLGEPSLSPEPGEEAQQGRPHTCGSFVLSPKGSARPLGAELSQGLVAYLHLQGDPALRGARAWERGRVGLGHPRSLRAKVREVESGIPGGAGRSCPPPGVRR